MKKVPVIALSLVAAATLAACGGRSYEASATPAPTAAVVLPATVVATPVVTYPSGTVTYVETMPGAVVYTAPLLRPGFGRIETMQRVVDANGAWTGYRRFSLRMDDGSVQVLDTKGPDIVLGERVELTTERNIRYPIASR